MSFLFENKLSATKNKNQPPDGLKTRANTLCFTLSVLWFDKYIRTNVQYRNNNVRGRNARFMCKTKCTYT